MNSLKKINIYIFIFFFSAYFIVMPGKINSTDGLALYLITKSIADKGSFDIEYISNGTVIGKDKKNYSPFLPGQPIMALPLYIFGKTIASSVENQNHRELIIRWIYTFSNVISISLLMVVFFNLHILFYNSYKNSLIATALLGFSTMLFHYAQTLFTEPFQALLILSAFYFYMKYLQTKKKIYIHFAGVCLAYNCFSKFPGFIYYIPFFLYLAYSLFKTKNYRENIEIFAVIIFYLFIAEATVLFYNYYRFGNILEVGSIDKSYSFQFINPVIGVSGFLFDKSKGIFITNPVLLLIFFTCVKTYKSKKKLFVFSLVLFLATLFFHSVFSYWPGAFCWGPRYLLPSLPFLFLLIDFSFLRSNRILKSFSIIIIVMSLIIQLLSILINPNSFLAFCSRNGFIYENTHDLPYVSSITGQALTISQNIREWLKLPPIIIYDKPLTGTGEAQIWAFHLLRYFSPTHKIMIFISVIYFFIITALFLLSRQLLKPNKIVSENFSWI